MNTRLSVEFKNNNPIAKKDILALKSSKNSKKIKKEKRKKQFAVKNMQRNDDVQNEELQFPHQPFCLGCFLVHVIAVLMFIPPREPLSLTIIKKILHSFYQQGNGFTQCRLMHQNNNPHQSLEDVLQSFDFATPQTQQNFQNGQQQP